MEYNYIPSKKSSKSICEDNNTLIGSDYEILSREPSNLHSGNYNFDVEILQKNQKPLPQRIVVSIKPRVPVIRKLFFTGNKRCYTKKNSSRTESILAIGDHSAITTSSSGEYKKKNIVEIVKAPSLNIQLESSGISKWSVSESPHARGYTSNDIYNSNKACYVHSQQVPTMYFHEIESNDNKTNTASNKVDIATLIITNTPSENSLQNSKTTLENLQNRLDYLERKITKQEMFFRSIDPTATLSSSDEQVKAKEMRSSSSTGHAGCSYIQQYSHVPETSAFQRYAHQTAPLSPSKATTIEKEHNSEQYGRDFTAYDGITARGRRQSASVPCKRNDVPRLAAERVHKIRHKLNPIRDYRLMDTVHYLAQGEFAPRDDGIKLTPSREAVLSDIIWEDVCRTHWPNARLGRRTDRCNTRYDLQRQIDNLLRERVAHVERRRRRHYRIVKLNQRHDNCRPLGKTGDIIVASHKNRQNEDRDLVSSDYNTGRRRKEKSPCRSHRSHDRIMHPETKLKRRYREEDCSPGPSFVTARSPTGREPMCCYQISPATNEISTSVTKKTTQCDKSQELSNRNSFSSNKPHHKNPRYKVKKESSLRKYSKDEPNLEHYVLLPTLVVRTPSNVRRQKKFNELYQRILHKQITNDQKSNEGSEPVEEWSTSNIDKKNVGLNIKITLSNTKEAIN